MQINIQNTYRHWKILLLIGFGISLVFDLLHWFAGFDGIPISDGFSLSRHGISGGISALLYFLYIHLKKEPESVKQGKCI
ncbi:hypothetical protein [Neisseria montereyensis]|uniref:Holin n=1 Tax=Neisseria montereyensis TaxID=2973938 RepID=A0ABT2FDV7_9NEIS|nr:hypothetical protein [Neisseria montereyensis]MCS4534323.1 hypothetical protein [Neisseria montereyensis]